MRLDFTALWIDDQPKHVESFAEGMKRKLKSLGFHLQTQSASSIEEVETYIGEHVHDDGIDLVLVDYDLGTGNGQGGEEVLATVRKKFPHKDIIFYSALDTSKLREIAYQKRLDGIYFSTRLTLVDDTLSLIDKLLRRVMDIDHMRGVVMSATSDIDYIVNETLKAMYQRMPKEEKDDALSAMYASLRRKAERWAGDLDKAEKKGDLDALLKLHHLCSAADRLKFMSHQLANISGDEGGYLATIRSYQEDVVPRRNKLAHVILRVVDGKRMLDGPDGAFSHTDMNKLRGDLIDHRRNFEDVAVLVDVNLE